MRRAAEGRAAWVLLLAGLFSPSHVEAQAVTFKGLPSCLLYGCSTSASAISADGTTVVGQRTNPQFVEFAQAFKWTETRGFEPTGIGGFLAEVVPSGVSADGSVVVGWTQFPGRAWRSTPGGTTRLGTLAPGDRSFAQGVSADGSVVVGWNSGRTTTEAFRWTQAEGMVGLGALDVIGFFSVANGISANGQVIVGQSQGPNGPEAFRWTQPAGMLGIGDLPGGTFSSSARAASADGAVIVGQGTSVNGPEAFHWTQTQGMRGLGDLPGGTFRSVAHALSGSGAVIVGDSDTARGSEAFIWTAASGMRSISGLLTDGGVNLSGWTLTSATGVSGDGTVIVGYGPGPSPRGGTEDQAWIARLGSPSSPPGLTTPTSLVESVANMYSVTLAGERIAQTDMRRVLDVARRYRSPATAEPARVASVGTVPATNIAEQRRWEAYALASGQAWNYDPLTQGTSPAVSAGIARDLSGAWRVGIGLSAEKASDDSIYDGRYRTTGVGGHAFASWNAGNPGWRVFGLTNYLDLDASIQRGYINGAGTATSSGSTTGYANGFLVRGEYSFSLGSRFELVPYADYSWVRTKLRPYTEDPAKGPFPASFEEQTYSSQVARAGLELGYRPMKETELFGWVAYAERVKGDTVSIAGQYLGLGAFNLQSLRVPDQNWVDVGVGFLYFIEPQVRLMGSLGVLAAGSLSTQSSVFASLGIGIGF